MPSLGFGLNRFVALVFRAPGVTAAVFLILIALSAVGLTRLSFEGNLRDGFSGESRIFAEYKQATDDFVDPENEILVLVEGDAIGRPDVFARLAALQLDLQLVDGVETVTSLFALRTPPDANGDTAPVVADPAAGLGPDLLARIRAHPLLGSRLVAADGHALVFAVTPGVAKATTDVLRGLIAEVRSVAEKALAGTGLSVTITGFPAIRVDIVDILIRDQIILNVAAALLGAVMSLIVFRSLVGALLTIGPAVLASGMVLAATGLLSIPISMMSNLVPTLIVILGFADAMHLSHAWRSHRAAGASPEEAERRAQADVGPACMLTSITTSLAFLSLVVSDVEMVRNFGWLGAIGTLAGAVIVLAVHALCAPVLGRLWHAGGAAPPDLLVRMGRPSAATCRFAIRHARTISAVSVVLFTVLAGLHFTVPAQHSLQEHLPRDNPANDGLRRIDQQFGGIYAVQVILPVPGVDPVSAAGLERIGVVHRAVAAVDGAGAPLSLWNLVEWLGGDPVAAAPGIADLLPTLPETTARRFVAGNGSALVMLTIPEMPTADADRLIGRIEAAARSAGGEAVAITGVGVLVARESIRTIDNLKLSLTLAVVGGLAAMVLAFRSWRIGVVAFLPNVLPIVATGSLLHLSGHGMQFTSVLSLTVAFGIAVDDTIHFLNRFMLTPGRTIEERLAGTARNVGPVLIGTTLIIIAGMSTTLASGLPTITLFGLLTSLTLAMALVGDVIVLPALMAGPLRGWFEALAPVRDGARARS